MIRRRLLLGRAATATFAVPALALPVAAASMPAGSSVAAAPPLPRRRPSSPAPTKKLVFVMLDPGHGGKDPGAIGVSGTYEKHVALAAAQELQRQLMATGRYRVALTRGDDVFIPLEDRVAMAQAHGAELFVSMHADALTDHSVRGASVYTLAAAASDAQTAALAVRENAADRFAGPAFRGATPEVARILTSLVSQETRVNSTHLAHDLVGELGRDVGLLQNPARHASFVVLKAPDIPSVLVEMGFMSNAADEAALREAAHRAQVAQAMRRAIDGFFAQKTQIQGSPMRLAG